MKKIYSLCMAVSFLAAALAGCGAESSQERDNVSSETQAFAETLTESETQGAESLQDAENPEISGGMAGADGAGDTPVVYMTTDISPEGLMAIYNALDVRLPDGNIAVKISTGENGSNYLRPELIGELVQTVHGTIVECNTAYGGDRASTAYHMQLAKDHGYTDIAEVDIMDAEGSMTLPVAGGTHLTENYVGEHFADYDYYIVLSHFKGHAMAGFGGAIKNIDRKSVV